MTSVSAASVRLGGAGVNRDQQASHHRFPNYAAYRDNPIGDFYRLQVDRVLR